MTPSYGADTSGIVVTIVVLVLLIGLVIAVFARLARIERRVRGEHRAEGDLQGPEGTESRRGPSAPLP